MDLVLLISILISGLIVIAVIELIRRNRLKEKYSLLWLFSSLVLLVFSTSRFLLDQFALFIGVKYPPSLIFLLGLIFLLAINIHFSTVISKLSEQNKRLAQELALLRESVQGGRNS